MTTLNQALAPFTGKYSASFLEAMRFTLSWETVFERGRYGDYDYVATEDVPGDNGGLTRYGIDQASHPLVVVPSLTLAGALGVYFCGEWTAIHGDALESHAALVTFDAAVNVGTAEAVKWLQETVGVKADGKFGIATLNAASQDNNPHLADALLADREAYYQRLGKIPHDHKFLLGWLNRTAALREDVTRLAA